jgi:hypothetical protein
LFTVLPTISGKPVGRHPIIVRLLKGIFNKKPPLPRYTILRTLTRFWLISWKLYTQLENCP